MARDVAELRRHFVPFPVEPGQRLLVERHPEQRWPVLQAYVPGALDHLYSISGVLAGAGPPRASSLCQKTAQWPPTLGVGTVFESRRDDALLGRGHDLPLLWYRQSCGRAVTPAGPPSDGVRWRYALPYHVDQGLQLWRARPRRPQLARYLAALRAPHVDIVLDARDPLPGLWFTAKMLRHPRALVHSLWRPASGAADDR